ncbi:MAG: methionyl-tRNA synthetase [Phylliscum demangeonii]|nr:MAG: methionyl-tRNA synthetase [Phylliscum demangeonii]
MEIMPIQAFLVLSRWSTIDLEKALDERIEGQLKALLPPHMGHLYTLVLADILKRWQVLTGRKALLCTGTDEHGMKVQQAAMTAGVEPKAFCDAGAEIFKNLAARANISNDFFIRTTDKDHQETVQHVWRLLVQKGYIYLGSHGGWYSVSDEAFYPHSAVHMTQNSWTGKETMVSLETGSPVEWSSELNYHFRLSDFRDRLLAFYKENPTFIVPQHRMNDVIQHVKEGLKDLSVSRPRERLQWGFAVPDNDSQTMYVWLDALVNYLTKAGYPWAPGHEHDGGWPADCHVIGKEITRFHCVYWPAFLMALDLPLPRRILTHAHWTVEDKKMSKSVGNVVDPFAAMEHFGTDTIRYYLAHDGRIGRDTNYRERMVMERYRKDCQNRLGNLLNRVFCSKRWKVRPAIQYAHARTRTMTNAGCKKHQERIQQLAPQVHALLVKFDLRYALRAIIDVVRLSNKLFADNEPWTLIESTKYRPRALAQQTVYLCAEALRICGILLQAFIPTKARELLDAIGVAEGRRALAHATVGADPDYGDASGPAQEGGEGGAGEKQLLFPPLKSAPVRDGGRVVKVVHARTATVQAPAEGANDV